MDIAEFISNFADEFDDTSAESFSPETEYRKLKEWDSLMALSIIAMVDELLEIRITGSELRNCNTIKELFDTIKLKQNG